MDGIEMSLTIGIFPHNGVNLKKEIVGVIQDKFKGTVKYENYNQPLKVIADINDWIEKATKKKVSALVATG